MKKTTIYALFYEGELIELPSDNPQDFPAQIVRSWTLEHKDYTGAVALTVGKKLAEERIGPAFGTDPETVALAKGLYAAEEVVKGWDWKSEDGTDLDVTPENIGTLPPVVLRQFWLKAVRKKYPTDAELEAMKLPLAKRSPASTEAAA